MFCDECCGAIAGADSACLQVQTVEQKGFGRTADYRDDRGSVEGGEFDSAAVTAPEGFARDAGGESAAGGTERPKGPGKTLQGLWREQENDSTGVSGGNKNEFREVAAATSAASWVATTGLGRKSDGSGFGGRLQQSECVHFDVPETVGDDTDAVFGGRKWRGVSKRAARLRRRP